MSKSLVNLEQKLRVPEIPEDWDYDNSVSRVKRIVYKWKNVTYELASELWIAREKLSQVGKPVLIGTNVPIWDSYCQDAGVERRTVNRWLAKFFKPQLPVSSNIPFPNDKFSVIYADPPWKYDFSETTAREIENKYPTMELEEIKSLKIPAKENSILFLWATAPKLREALEVMVAWGFEYKTHAVWDKIKIGMGYWFRGRHELLLVGTKGDYSVPSEDLRISSVYRERRSIHSKKPEYFREIIEKIYPNNSKIELFARERRMGWESWGNQL